MVTIVPGEPGRGNVPSDSPYENRIPVEEVAGIVRELFDRPAAFRLAAIEPIDWLGGVLVTFETESGTLTLHEPGRKIVRLQRRYGPFVGRLDLLIAAGKAVRWTYDRFPWSEVLSLTLPEPCSDEEFRISLVERKGPVEMPSRVDITFGPDGTVTWLSAYHEADAPVPEVHLTREQAIELAARFADTHSEIFRGLRHGDVSLAVRLYDHVFRTVWRVNFPKAVRRPDLGTFALGFGGNIQLDATTGEILAFDRYK